MRLVKGYCTVVNAIGVPGKVRRRRSNANDSSVRPWSWAIVKGFDGNDNGKVEGMCGSAAVVVSGQRCSMVVGGDGNCLSVLVDGGVVSLYYFY